jgi:hypothetical protein
MSLTIPNNELGRNLHPARGEEADSPRLERKVKYLKKFTATMGPHVPLQD